MTVSIDLSTTRLAQVRHELSERRFALCGRLQECAGGQQNGDVANPYCRRRALDHEFGMAGDARYPPSFREPRQSARLRAIERA